MSLLYGEEADSYLYDIEIVSLISVEEAAVFSVRRRVSFCSVQEAHSSLYNIESVSSVRRGGRLLLCTEERVPLCPIEDADSVDAQQKECLSWL